jgi:hypothetical protein
MVPQACAAAGAEHRIAFVGDDDSRPRASFDVIDDLVRQVVHIDHGFADAGICQLVEHMIQQRFAGHRYQRLRHPLGQRTHPQAETGGENHGFAGFDGHAWKFS